MNPIFLQVNGLNGQVVFRTLNLVNDSLYSFSSEKDPFFYSEMIRNQHVRQGQLQSAMNSGRRSGSCSSQLLPMPPTGYSRICAWLF